MLHLLWSLNQLTLKEVTPYCLQMIERFLKVGDIPRHWKF